MNAKSNYRNVIIINVKNHCHLEKYLVIAKFGSAHGIIGWIKVFSFTEKKENIFNYLPWSIKKNGLIKIIDLQSWKKYNKNFLVKIDKINNRQLSEKLTNYYILINKNKLPEPKFNEYYWKDLIHCTVFTIQQKLIGIVISLMRTESHDILIIKNDITESISKKEILIPFINQKIIKQINIRKKIIVVKWNFEF